MKVEISGVLCLLILADIISQYYITPISPNCQAYLHNKLVTKTYKNPGKIGKYRNKIIRNQDKCLYIVYITIGGKSIGSMDSLELYI